MEARRIITGGGMWKVAAQGPHLRLFFATHAVAVHAAEAARLALEAPTQLLRQTIGTSEAAEAAEALLGVLESLGLREAVQRAASACERPGREFNEQDAQQVIPGLWIGPLGPAESAEWLRTHGVSHVVDMTGGWRRRVSALENAWERLPAPPHAEAGVVSLVLDAEDRPTFEISPLFAQTNQFLREALHSRPEAAVLVHCHSGVSRSATIVIAYLMSSYGLTLREALRVVRDARPSVSPNAGFERQLVRYEMQLKTKARVAAVPEAPAERVKRARADGPEDPAPSRPPAPLDTAAAAAEPPTAADLAGLELAEALGRLQAHMGSVPKFARVAGALEELLLRELRPQTAALFHKALRTAIGNGKGPKLAKLRAAYCSLFDAAASRINSFPTDLAADVAAWTLCAATHGRVTKPEKAHSTSQLRQPIDQVADLLRRLQTEQKCRAGTCGGSLRGLVTQQLFEVLETLNGLWKQEPGLHTEVRDVIALSAQVENGFWSTEQHRTILKWLSTMRARTG